MIIDGITTVSGVEIDTAELAQLDSSVAKGVVKQIVTFQTGVVDSTANIIAYDNSKPQITEGKEFMTLSITPKDANNKLMISVIGMFGGSVDATWITMALFEGTGVNALAAVHNFEPGIDSGVTLPLTHIMTAGVTSQLTFRMRGGINGGGTIGFNGHGGSQYYGGAASSSIIITEFTP